MNAAKFCPRPTGSRIVKRTLPGGRAVSRRNITARSASTASVRPASATSKSSDCSGNGHNAGRLKSGRPDRDASVPSPLPLSPEGRGEKLLLPSPLGGEGEG